MARGDIMLSLQRSRARSCRRGTRIDEPTSDGQTFVQRQGGTDVEMELGGHEWEQDIVDVAPSLRPVELPDEFAGCPDCQSTEHLQWVFVRTAPETWENKRGRAGWVLRCAEHRTEHAYIGEIAG